MAVLFGNAYRKAVTVVTVISVFWPTGIWPVNRGIYQDLCFFSSVANTHRTDDVHPFQAALQDEARTSQASSQRTRSGNTSLLIPMKYLLFQKLILPTVLRRSMGPKCLRRRLN
jgi:hypothetical protein